MGMVSSLLGGGGGGAKKGSEQEMAGISQAERYLGDYFAPMQQRQGQARDMMAGFYGLGGGSQADMYNQMAQSPQYDYLRGVGEQGVMRNASATGGLRSGNANQALAQSNQGVLQGLVGQQMQGLNYFANQDAGQGTLADMMMKKAQVQGQGTVAEAQSKQGGLGNLMNLGMGAAQMYGGTGGFSGGGGGGGGSQLI